MSFPTVASAAPREFHDRLRHFRENAALTREEVAVTMGRSAGAVRDWELGQRRPNAVQIAKMARAYNVTIAELTATSEAP